MHTQPPYVNANRASLRKYGGKEIIKIFSHFLTNLEHVPIEYIPYQHQTQELQ